MNLHVDGPSAAGKTFVVNHVAALFPDAAVYPLTSSSERCFVYTEADFRHRHLIIGSDHL